MWYRGLAYVSVILASVAARQNPFRYSQCRKATIVSFTNHLIAYNQNYDDGLFTPAGDLSVLSQDSFTMLGHPAFPAHSVRIKKSSFCDGNVS